MKKIFLLTLISSSLIFAIYDLKIIDINYWRSPFCNDGRFGYDVISRRAGGYWPYPLRNFYIFGAGPWVGCIMNGETLVTAGYNDYTTTTEFVPTLCRYWRQGYNDSLDRIYKYPGDWPPPRSRFPMAPLNPLSNMDLWCCFGDSDPSAHRSNDTRPIGIDITLTVYGFLDTIARDFFLLKYELFNNNQYPINNVYFGVVLDGDIGSYSDDMMGLILNKIFRIGSDTIRVKNVGFIYDYDNRESRGTYWERGTPGAVAIRLLSAPQGLGMSACKRWTIESLPRTDKERYRAMAGYNWITGEYRPYDNIDETPGDKRFIISSGPFNLSPMSSVQFYYAVIGSPYGEEGQPYNQRDTTELAKRCYWSERIFKERIGILEEQNSPQISQSRIKIYPNPAKSFFTICLPQPTDCIKIYDISGKLIYILQPKGSKFSIPISDFLKDGVYFIKVGEEKEKLIIKK